MKKVVSWDWYERIVWIFDDLRAMGEYIHGDPFAEVESHVLRDRSIDGACGQGREKT